MFQKCKESGKLDSKDSLSLIDQLVRRTLSTVIIIDALDECKRGDRADLFEVMKRLIRGSAHSVKIFVTSRKSSDITFHLSNFPNIGISYGRNQDDIKAFIECEKYRLVSRGEILLHSSSKDKMQAMIIDKVSRDAGGM